MAEYKNKLEVSFQTSEGKFQIYKFIVPDEVRLRRSEIIKDKFEEYWGRKCESYGAFSVMAHHSFINENYFCMDVDTPGGTIWVHFILLAPREQIEAYFINAVAQILS